MRASPLPGRPPRSLRRVLVSLALAGSVLGGCTSERPETPTGPPATVAPPEARDVELSAPCSEAIAPVRELQDRYPPGSALPDADRDVLMSLLEASYDGCSIEEFYEFQDFELAPWLRSLQGRS